MEKNKRPSSAIHNSSSVGDVSFSGVKGISRAWVRRVVKKTLQFEKFKGKTVSVLLTDNATIRRLNRRFLKHDYATDVISFGFEDSKNLGDLAVSAEMASEVSKTLHIPYREELARYLVHGTLHLLGYNDQKKKDAQKMHERQESILKTL